MKCYYKEQPNENSLIVENKFNPISHRPCVHFGTKLKVLIAYFEEKRNSLHLFIIFNFSLKKQNDRIPSTTPGAEPRRDARDSGSARSHSMHLETSSSDRP